MLDISANENITYSDNILRRHDIITGLSPWMKSSHTCTLSFEKFSF